MSRCQPLLGALGAVDRDRVGAALAVPVVAHDEVRAHVDAVVGVEVAEEDGIEVVETDMALQLAEGAVAHVEEQPEAVGLYEVARACRTR